MSELPDPVLRAISNALAEVHKSDDHSLAPKSRVAIYHALGPLSRLPSYRTQVWVALLAARRVLPIFQRAHLTPQPPHRLAHPLRLDAPVPPDMLDALITSRKITWEGHLANTPEQEQKDRAAWRYGTIPYDEPLDVLPMQLVTIAEDVVRGRLRLDMPPKSDVIQEHVSNNTASVDERLLWERMDHAHFALQRLADDGYPPNARCAARACQQAVTVTCGYEPLRHYHSVTIRSQDGTLKRGDQLTDRDLTSSAGDLDAAAYAAIASSWRAVDRPLDAAVLAAFWEWWLTEAWPVAWNAAQKPLDQR